MRILVDKWGVPHIRAANRRDLFIAQGFNAARERLFQMDLWRRRGLGLLSEAFGSQHLERDRAARLFLYRGDMGEEWDAYGPGAEDAIRSFTIGVNAYIAYVLSDQERLPIEFRELGYLPSLWDAGDIIRIRSHGWFGNAEQEVARARTLFRFGTAVEELRQLRDGCGAIVVPDDLDLSLFEDDVLRLYRLATRPASLDEGNRDAQQARTVDGSNCWVISPSRTSTGRPILASDPHRALTVPSLRYIAHLSAPGLDVIGAGEPCLPGISIGHNGRLAFGLTVFSIDQEDLYVYRTRPGHPREYWYDGRWEPMRHSLEYIAVRGAPGEAVDLWFTRHGPVIHEIPDRHAAFALRAAWLESGMAPYMGGLACMSASNADEFVRALDAWGSPGENYLYAQVDGSVGHKAAGRVPLRPNWDGSLPVPGDGRYEWAGYLDMSQLPAARNPEAGWLASANEHNVSAELEKRFTVCAEWPTPFRYERIAEQLSAKNDWTVSACLDLQHDYCSVPYMRLRPVLEGLVASDPTVASARRLLLQWDGNETPDSGAAALFEIWLKGPLRTGIRRHALSRLVPPDRLASALDAVLPKDPFDGDPRIDLDLVLSPSGRLGPDHQEAIAAVLSTSLRAAYHEAERLLGSDQAAWKWGALHRIRLVHPAHPLGGAARHNWTELPGIARGGSGDTIGSTWLASDYSQVGGASFRMIIDVGGWDRSVAMNSPGQSGRPESEHYQDLLRNWAQDSAFPLLYTDAAVAAAISESVTLEPLAGGNPLTPASET